ncbi:hypothetical protein FQZ97_774730 [compost metagenome]
MASLSLRSSEVSGVLFRKNSSAHETKIQAWLASTIYRANIIALEVAREFSGITPEDIQSLVSLSLTPERIVELPEILARRHGIVLVIRPGYPSMKMDGCALMLPSGNPMIGLSLRYNRYDNFWFTLVHELSHICLHLEHLDNPIIDDLDEAAGDDIEIEANSLARESFVPRREWRILYEKRYDEALLSRVCEQIGTHPDIVAGLIRYAANNYKLYPSHHRAIDLKSILGFKDA